MTNEQLIAVVAAGLAVGAIALGVVMVVLFRRLAVWWALREKPEPGEALPVPRSLGRGARVMTVSLVALAAAMGIEYTQVKFSVAGGAIDGLLDHLRTLFEAVWRVGMGFSFHALIVDYLAWRRISFGELLTNKPAPWRTEDEPFEPFASATVQAAAVLGYMGVLGVVLVIFGSLG